MRQQRLLLLVFVFCISLPACSPGHVGSNVLAFVRDGHLWTVDPDGANAFEVVAQNNPVVGYAWSPTHEILSYRQLDPDFARSSSAQHLSGSSPSGLSTDAPSTLNTIGVDGGTPISIAFSSSDVRYSNPLWNSNGTRLLYRQTAFSPPGNPARVRWWMSQNDQPGGIALKSLPPSYSIPSLSYNPQHYLSIGNSSSGLFTTTLDGTGLRYLQREPLSGHPLPASLERVLWQPGHSDYFLYARSPASPSTSQPASPEPSSSVELVLQSVTGQPSILAMCTCLQFAWSPDGHFILYSTGTHYSLLNVQNRSSFSFAVEEGSVPYWSPDSAFLLVDAPRSLSLIQGATRRQLTLLGTLQPQNDALGRQGMPTTSALLQPVANSIWAADSRHLLFLSRDRLLWQEPSLRLANGLYTVAIDKNGRVQGKPLLVDSGHDTQAGWSYQDPNTSFLY